MKENASRQKQRLQDLLGRLEAQGINDSNKALHSKVTALLKRLEELGILRQTRYGLGGAFVQSKLAVMPLVSGALMSEVEMTDGMASPRQSDEKVQKQRTQKHSHSHSSHRDEGSSSGHSSSRSGKSSKHK